MAPDLWSGPDGAYLSWIEPVGGGEGHRLLVSHLVGEAWRAPVEVASGNDFFANWADLPGGVVAGDGSLYMHWLAKLGDGTYAYGVYLARSTDGGLTWEHLGLLHDDDSATEHGFVSYQALPGTDGEVQVAWLDGRATADGGAMQLRTTRLIDGVVAPSTLLAKQVCDCCDTDMALSTAGPLIAVRGRTGSEVRDIWTIRANDSGWSSPAAVFDDGWTIAGCPVNGPAIVAEGDRVALAWFSAANAQGQVKVAFSEDGGARFAPPIMIDDAEPLGRVGSALAEDGAWVSWLARGETSAEVRAQHVRFSGVPSPVETVAATSAARSAGVPRLLREGNRLLIAWVADEDPSRILVAERRLAERPPER